MNFVRGYASNSVSPTDIWELEETNKKYIAKIYISAYDGKKVESAQFFEQEATVYLKIRDSLIDKGSRYFLRIKDHLRDVTVDELYQKIVGKLGDDRAVVNLRKNIAYMFDPSEQEDRDSIDEPIDGETPERINVAREELAVFSKTLQFGIIITEKIEGSFFRDYLLANPRSPFNMSAISSVFFAIYCMSQSGINNNDLHWDNILASSNKDECPFFDSYLLYFKNKLYTMSDHIIPIIYDFDRSVMRGQDAKWLTPYAWTGNCTFFNKNRDLIKGICEFSLIVYTLRDTSDVPILEDYDKLFDECYMAVKSPALKESIYTGECFFSQGEGKSALCTENLDDFDAERFIENILNLNPHVERGLDPSNPIVQRLKERVESETQGSTVEEKRRLALSNIAHAPSDASKIKRLIQKLF